MPFRLMLLAVWVFFAVSAPLRPAEAAKSAHESLEERRQARLISHLKRIQHPEGWTLVRKLFSSNAGRQLRGLSKCPRSDTEWPWYLSSGHLQDYRFQVDFIPVNLDDDPDEEILIVIQTDPGEVNYISFCVLDDEKRGRVPIASYSDLSRDRPVTFQITDITNDGGAELILYSRDGNPDEFTESVRIIKLNKANHFELVWFGRLRDHLVWPARRVDNGREQIVSRSERLRAKMRLWSDGPKKPSVIVLSGEREYREVVSFQDGSKRVRRNSVEKFPFVEYWNWNEKLFHFVRAAARE